MLCGVDDLRSDSWVYLPTCADHLRDAMMRGFCMSISFAMCDDDRLVECRTLAWADK